MFLEESMKQKKIYETPIIEIELIIKDDVLTYDGSGEPGIDVSDFYK